MCGGWIGPSGGRIYRETDIRKELARLTGGAHITPTMLEGAEELLSAAEDFKRTLE